MADILVIDDEPDIRQLLADVLASEGHKVQTVADGDAALDLLRRQPFDLALVDIWLPGVHGLELVHRLRELAPDLPLVLITARPALETAVLALRLGVDDYLTKPLDLKTVRATVARLTAPRSREEEQRWLAEQLARARPRLAEAERRWQSLTEREREVLRLVAQGQSNQQIAQFLDISEHTVATHLRNLLDKLGVGNRVQAARLWWEYWGIPGKIPNFRD